MSVCVSAAFICYYFAFADALAWVMHCNGINRQLHYLDDFLFLGAPSSHECAASLQTALQVCRRLGVLVAAHKTEGPSTCLTFLGIHIDSVAMQLRSSAPATKRESSLSLCGPPTVASQGLVPQTIKAYLSAIRFFHIMAGHGDPFAPGALPRLQYVVRGIKRAPRSPSRPRLPLTPPLLQAIKTCWAPKAAEADTVMLWAAFMRAGKFTVTSAQDVEQETCLSAQDVAVDSHANPSMVRVHLKQSKTDPFRHGVDIFLGRTDALCPVAAILAYCAIRPAIAIVFEDVSPLTRERLVVAVRSVLSHAGVNTAHYSGHSFRVGAATAAARAGLQEATIKMLGRWESSAYERYVRMPRESLAAISRQLSRGC